MNNAGTTIKGWEKVMQLNVTSVFNCIQQFLPLLRKAGSAQNPMAGISSFGEQAYAYGPSKAALHQLSRILARELVSQHINVNVIAPGRFPSKMTQHIGNDEQALAQDTALIPMKRWGREEEMAALAISLASTAGAYMTGNIIPLDGGSACRSAVRLSRAGSLPQDLSTPQTCGSEPAREEAGTGATWLEARRVIMPTLFPRLDLKP